MPPKFSENILEHSDRLIYSIALIYLLLPSAFVLFFFGSWLVGIAVSISLAFLWADAWANSNDVQMRSSNLLINNWPYLVLAGLAAGLSGAIPPFAENSDWYKHYAILNSLIDYSWPPQVPIQNGIGTLRYSLSFYVVPAMAAKYLGAWTLSYAIFSWETLGLFIVMVLAFGSSSRFCIKPFLLGCIFLLFSGADVIGTSWTGITRGGPFHIEWWAGFGELASSITNFFWTPQHAIAGWLSAFLVLRNPTRSLRNAGVIAAALVMWSPFAAVGLVPIILWVVFKEGVGNLFSMSNLIAAPMLLVSAALFLTRGSDGIPYGVVWDAPGFSISVWLVFLFLEVGAIALGLLIIQPGQFFFVAFMTTALVVLSLFCVGSNNDLLMRGSIPILGIFAAMSATAVVYAPNMFRKTYLIICLAIGVVTPLGEVLRALTSNRILNSRAITFPDAVQGREYLLTQYLVFEGIESKPIINLRELVFSTFGDASFDKDKNRVFSDGYYVDAALVSNEISLPSGFYKIDAVFNWDVIPQNVFKNGGHLSIHGNKILIPIAGGKFSHKLVSAYFSSDGNPFQISFGLGGWSKGRGFVELKELSISAIEQKTIGG